MGKSKSRIFGEKERKLKAEVIKELRKHLGKKRVELENGFEDEANNDIIAIDRDNVYFNNGVDSYALSGLGLLDAIYLIGMMELNLVVSK